jgi:hypothetical protein
MSNMTQGGSAIPSDECENLRMIIIKAAKDAAFKGRLLNPNTTEKAIQESGYGPISKEATDAIKSLDENEMNAVASLDAKARQYGLREKCFF